MCDDRFFLFVGFAARGTGSCMSIAGRNLLLTGNFLPITSNSVSITGRFMSITGSVVSITGRFMSLAGNFMSITGKTVMIPLSARLAPNKKADPKGLASLL
ncbi:hypothetical protein AS29_010280 [Bacillus sp. SJS]|nr:hypothetical protein AS29_010280 [Bacillus sp. SJS]